jgi:hypothetical protein
MGCLVTGNRKHGSYGSYGKDGSYEKPFIAPILLVPKLHLGTGLDAKLYFAGL